jgi:hypothetical protein
MKYHFYVVDDASVKIGPFQTEQIAEQFVGDNQELFSNTLHIEQLNNPSYLEYMKSIYNNELKKQFVDNFYSDVEVIVDDTIQIIQFRNDEDRINLTNVAQVASLKIANNDPEALITFRVKSNENLLFTASEFAEIATCIFDQKQAIRNIFWSYKDQINQLDFDTVDSFNINELDWSF